MISVGIDIGAFSIKVAQVEGSAKGFQVLQLEEYPLTQDPSKDATIDIIEALRAIRTKYVKEGVQVVISARQNHVSVRRLPFPFRERHKILRSLPFELEDDIPLSVENAIFDAKISQFVPDAADVIAFACPKEHVVDRLKHFDDTHIGVNLMSIEGVGLANVFENWAEAPPFATAEAIEHSQADAYLHIGHRETVCSILQNGVLIDAFAIDWGGTDLAEILTVKYSLQYTEALKEVRKKGFILINDEGASKDQIVFSDILKSSLDQLATPLKLGLAEIESAHKVKLSQVILTGGTSLLKNIGPYLTQKLEIATNRLTGLDRFPNLNFGNSPNNEISYPIAIGLAAEGLRRPKNPAVNLLKGEFASQNQTMKVFWETWSPIINSVAILFVLFFIWSFIRESTALEIASEADNRLRTQARNVAGLRGAKASRRNIRKHIREQEMKVKQREVLDDLQDITSALDVFRRTTLLFPAKNAGKIKLTQLSVRNNQVRMSGFVERPQLVQQIQNSLRSLSSDKKVTSSAYQGRPPAGYTGFNFTFRVPRRTGG